jgi:hypothetical protein
VELIRAAVFCAMVIVPIALPYFCSISIMIGLLLLCLTNFCCSLMACVADAPFFAGLGNLTR